MGAAWTLGTTGPTADLPGDVAAAGLVRAIVARVPAGPAGLRAGPSVLADRGPAANALGEAALGVAASAGLAAVGLATAADRRHAADVADLAVPRDPLPRAEAALLPLLAELIQLFADPNALGLQEALLGHVLRHRAPSREPLELRLLPSNDRSEI